MFWNIINMAKKWVEESSKIATDLNNQVSSVSKDIWKKALSGINEAWEQLGNITKFDWIVESIEENKDKLLNWLEKRFINKTNLDGNAFSKMKKVSEHIVNNVWKNLEDFENQKWEVINFINNEIKKSEISLLSDIDLNNSQQKEITNYMFTLVWVLIILMFPSLIPEIIWAIIDPIDILEIILEADEK